MKGKRKTKEKQSQKRHYAQYYKLLFRFPKHTLLPLYCFEWLLSENEASNPIIYLFKTYSY